MQSYFQQHCLTQPSSWGECLLLGKAVLKSSQRLPVFYTNHIEEYPERSCLVGYHPSHTQMPLKDFHFIFCLSISSLTLKCQCSSGISFLDPFYFLSGSSTAILRVITTFMLHVFPYPNFSAYFFILIFHSTSTSTCPKLD